MFRRWSRLSSPLPEASMRKCLRMTALALIALGPAPAGAETALAAGARDGEFAQIIRQGGYDGLRVEAILASPDPPAGWESLRPEVAVCADGRRYLVTKSGRSGGNVRPVVRPM